MADLISELYESTHEADKPFVDQITAAIQAEIETRTAADDEFQFNYDMAPLIGDLPLQQQGRIKAEVIKFLRQNGIRVGLTNQSLPGDIQPAPNPPELSYLTLYIRWFIRNQREYGKHYM